MGFEIMRLQDGDQPLHWRPVKDLGRGVKEIKVSFGGDTFRTIYVVKKAGKLYIVHAFQKKSQRIPKEHIDIIKERLKLINK
jgi:phage-related protein